MWSPYTPRIVDTSGLPGAEWQTLGCDLDFVHNEALLSWGRGPGIHFVLDVVVCCVLLVYDGACFLCLVFFCVFFMVCVSMFAGVRCLGFCLVLLFAVLKLIRFFVFHV